ncbi:MAG: metallophosphoesterase [Woeseiaceae bacterium]
MLRVLHLTDPHLFAAKDGNLRGTVTFASLSAVLEDYQASDWHADIAVVTGDLIQDDTAAAYENFRDLLSSLGLPVYCVPGNHDVRELMRDALQDPPFVYCGTVRRNSWLIVGVDSCVSERAGGSIAAAEFDRVDAEIAASDAAHVMLYLHHPPVALGSRWLDSVGMDNGDEALRRFAASGKVRLAIFGHVHQDFATEHADIQIIATPSTCSQFAAGSAEFAIDDNPPAYRRIELHDDGTHHNELIWVGNSV